MFVYFGSGAPALDQGIYVSEFDSVRGILGEANRVFEIKNPGFMVSHPKLPILYTTAESDANEGKIAAFNLHKTSGKISLVNEISSVIGRGCYLAIDANARFLMMANYAFGRVGLYRLADDGSIVEMSDKHQHVGSSVDKNRQQGPHAHSIILDKSQKFALAADLGTDSILIYRIEGDRLHQIKIVRVHPGSGPRHMCFHPIQPFLYVINEISSTIHTYLFDSEKGDLSLKSEVSTLPTSFSDRNGPAEIAMHPGGNFLFASNRGHDSIVRFAIDKNHGQLHDPQWAPSQGKTPRYFAIEPSGNFLIVTNQDSNDVFVFKIERVSKKLEQHGKSIYVPTAGCVALANS